MKVLGILLIVLGLAALAYQGFTCTSRETVLDIGPLHATAEREKTVPLPPIVGGIAIASGVVLLIVGASVTTARSTLLCSDAIGTAEQKIADLQTDISSN
jgi:hypothetical protein